MILYPVIFAIWVVLGAYAPHLQVGEVQFDDISRALVLVPACTLLTWGVLGYLSKNWSLSALFVWVNLILLFTYKAQHEFLLEHVPEWMGSAANFVVGLAWIAVCGVVYRVKDGVEHATKFLNIASGCLLAIPLFTIFAHSSEVSLSLVDPAAAEPESSMRTEQNYEDNQSRSLPNIIYIILDGYGRDDVLRESYGFDNSGFLSDLMEKGFYIARNSRANYAQTTLSLASTLNYQYLDPVAQEWGVETRNRKPLRQLIQHNRLVNVLKKHGYSTIAFSSGISFTELRESDSYLVPANALNEWESFFLLQTPVPAFMKTALDYSLYDIHKARLQYVFENLPKAPVTSGPRFVFAHIVAPHPPFVLGRQDSYWQQANTFSFRDGSEYRYHYDVTSAEYRKRYIEQVKAINQMMRMALSQLLADAERPTVIVLQSDHGPGAELDWEDPNNTSFKERLSILNAYHIPDGEDIGLYPSISPVNTFRLILNHYFDESLPLLQDESYFSTMDRPYEFLWVTDQVRTE
ncbi:MAG: LTA synthase family protein [Nitrospirales bacterium]|nr:sulfatase-like hydrolase/transferase [Nitrospira sp.]MDR4501761.1 LTA synthase family protein [Nitrospirales bacterium]